MKNTLIDIAYLTVIGLFVWQLAGAQIKTAMVKSTTLLRIGAKSPQFAAGYRFGYIAGNYAAMERGKHGGRV